MFVKLMRKEGEAIDTIITIGGLDEEVQRRQQLLIYNFDERELEILNKWMSMFTIGYINEKIIEARLANKLSCVLAKEKFQSTNHIRSNSGREDYHKEALFYGSKGPGQVISVKEHIESLIDKKEILLRFYHTNDKIAIHLTWDPVLRILPRFMIDYPGASVLGVLGLSLLCLCFYLMISGR